MALGFLHSVAQHAIHRLGTESPFSQNGRLAQTPPRGKRELLHHSSSPLHTTPPAPDKESKCSRTQGRQEGTSASAEGKIGKTAA